MRARWLLAPLAVALLLAVATQASAQSATSSSAIDMQGQAQVDQSGRLPQLLLSADASGNSGYHLDVALAPVQSGERRFRGGGDDDERAPSGGGSNLRAQQVQRSRGIGLSGRYSLSDNGATVAGGQATGQLDQSGNGTLTLDDNTGAPVMQLDFTIDGSGSLEATLSGQIPGITSTGTTGATAAAAAAAQPDNGNHVFWYLSRAAGLSAYLMLFLNVVFGLAVHTKVMDKIYARWKSLDLHQFTTLLALGLLAIHGLALLGDHYIGFTIPEILVPLLSPYRPLWTAIGIIGAYLLAVVAASSYLRKQMSYGTWRSLHYLSFAAYVLALGHGIFSGTDTSQPWAQALYWITGGIIAVLMVWRFRKAHAPAPQRAQAQPGSPMRRGVS